MIDLKTLAAQERAHLIMEYAGFSVPGGAELRRLAMRYLVLREHGVLLRQEAVVFDVVDLDAAADRLIQEMMK